MLALGHLLFATTAMVACSDTAKESSLRPPWPQKQQCNIQPLTMAMSSPDTSMGWNKEPQNWQASERPPGW